MVGLAAKRIDFPSHFLSDETEFFALSVAAFQRADEIFQVVGEALFFLVDIQLFDVVDQFLFQFGSCRSLCSASFRARR